MSGARTLIFVLAATGAAAASPAGAQCRLCDTPSTAPIGSAVAEDVRLEIETTLDFDRLILTAMNQGSALVRPDGSTAATGSVADVGARARFATVVVRGQADRLLRITLPRRIELYGLNGSRLTFDEVTTDAPDLPKLDSTGSFTFHIGGRLRFAGNEEGDYRGDLPITVDYQ